MKILVTGGAGHIGSFLVDELIGKDHGVTILDDFSIGKIKHCNRQADILSGSILDDASVLMYLRDLYPDVIVNCAVKPLLMSFDKPQELVAVNYFGVKTLLDAVVEVYDAAEYPLFVQLSTSEVYGGGNITDATPKRPKTVYAQSKHAADELVRLYHFTHKIPYAIARPFNSVGERMRLDEYANVVYKTFMRLLVEKPVVIEGSGMQERDFPYVKDIARGIRMMIADPAAHNMELNFSTGIPHTIGNIIGKCVELVVGNRQCRTEHAPKRSGDYHLLTCDADAAFGILGWKAETQIDAALQATYEWIADALGVTPK